MTALILGLVLFLGTHSVRIFAADWRAARLAGMGEKKWKGLYTLVALMGLGLVIWGYGQARMAPTVLWTPPTGMRHLAALLTLVAFVLITAANVPRNHFKARLGHPMLAGTKLWALAHLLANGTVADVLLFGAFLAWAIAGFASARRRDRAAKVVYPAGTARGTAITVVVGIALWAVFAFWAHGWLIGVRPLG